MDVAFIADVHIGNHRRFGGQTVNGINHRCRMILDALRSTVDRLNNLQVRVLVVLGDLFDDSRPSPQVLSATADELMRFDGLVYLLVGNHDQHSETPGDHALSPLRYLDNVRVVDEPTTFKLRGYKVRLIPYRTGNVEEWLPGMIKDGQTILCMHVGIKTVTTPHYLMDSPDAIGLGRLRSLLMKGPRGGLTELVAVGNWHEHGVWYPEREEEPIVLQAGALVPTGFDNIYPWFGCSIVGLFGVDNTDRIRDVSTIRAPGPRFLKMDYYAVPDQVEVRESDHERKIWFYLEIKAKPAEMAAARERMEQHKAAGWCADYVIVPDATDSYTAARSAAAAARHAESVDEAVISYVNNMGLEKGLQPKVLRRVQHYLDRK